MMVRILVKEAKAEIEVRKSRFIALAIPVTSLQEVKTKVQEVKNNYSDATHVVHAAVVGASRNEFSFSDDREPKNTAGRPAFEVLKGTDITNILICIIRYFGGTLLGTGGLVKAYGDSVKAVLPLLSCEELVAKKCISFTLTYDCYTQTKRLLEEAEASILREDFGTTITLEASIAESKCDALCAALTSYSSARILIETL